MATKRSCGCCCFRFSCFSCLRFSCFSCFRKPDHPTSGPGAQSSPPAIGTLPGAQAPIPGPFNVVTPPENKTEHVDVDINVSGTHPSGNAPVSESPGKYVPEAPQCNEDPSSSTSGVATILHDIDTIKQDIVQTDGKNVDVNLDDLMKHISDLLKQREEEMREKKKASNPSSNFPWPKGSGFTNLKNILSFKNLKDISSLGDFKNLTNLLQSGLDAASKWTQIISGPVTNFLKDVGQVSVFTAGLLVVANTLETFQAVSSNHQECLALLKEMSYFATIVKRLTERPGEKQEVVIQESVTLIVEGAILCCTNMESSYWKSFFSTSKVKDDLSGMRKKLEDKYRKIDIVIGLRLLTNTERVLAAMAARNSPLSKRYPEHAVGIEESIEDVMKLLECDDNGKKAVTVILHGFGGIGKTTLADAVFSQVKGCKCSEVQLSNDISSEHIIQLQRKILEHLKEPGEPIPDIPKPEDGQRELGQMLEKVEAFIYINNVLNKEQLKLLLPQDLDKAKKVRFLLTASNADVKRAFRRPPKIYRVEGIKKPEDALSILKKDILEGISSEQFAKIIERCHGIPLMLGLVARFIAYADNKGSAYDELMQEEAIWKKEDFNEMSLCFAYDALPEECKDPFLDICSYFRRWDWDTVENIVGKDELQKLENRALVTKDTFTGVVNVHDVILQLGFHMSKGKQVRLTCSSASELEASLKEKKEGAEGIKGIWLSGNQDLLKISATTLDSMHKSLRVLQLGDLPAEVEGECSEIFEELVFFKAKVGQLPFYDMSKLKKLKYLSYTPNELKLSEMPSTLRHMEFDGSSDSHVFQISSQDLQHHKDLIILRLVNFEKLTNLEFGDQVTSLQELSLSNCKSIEKLPNSISKLRSLRILEMNNCFKLTELPVDFGSLSSLQELNLARCWRLKALPDSIDKLSSLKVLNLSGCQQLLNLPSGLGKLTCLVELNIESCTSLENIPESIGQLRQLRVLHMELCERLKELPDGFCNLSFITYLSFKGCKKLAKLPDRFGQLKSLEVLRMIYCVKVQKLPQGFGQLKNLKGLHIEGCIQLSELCTDFHCLSSLQQLYLTDCDSLEKLPEDFNFLSSLQSLFLDDCPKLEGKSMDHVTKMNTLELVSITGSDELVQRWGEIKRDCPGSSYPLVIDSEEMLISEDNKESMKNSVLSELDGLLKNGRGEEVRLFDLLRNTSALLIFDNDPDKDQFPWPLIEETVDYGMQIKIIHIGPQFDQLSTKVKDTIFVGHTSGNRLQDICMKMVATRDADGDGDADVRYLQMDAKMVGDGSSDNYADNYAPFFCWRFLTKGELEEFVVCHSRRYLQLKQLQEKADEGSSNIKMLTELFAPHGDKTTPVFRKNESSQKDRTENSERETTCGVDQLEGKTILVEMWPYNSWRCEINPQFWKERHFMEKEKVDLEIISIPIVYPSKEYNVNDVYKQFSRQVPWLVLQNSWTVITRAVKFFFEKHCGWEESAECEKLYPTINWIIEPNGRISVYRPYIFLKEEWEQPKNMSTLEFLFNHSESVSAQVQKLMLPRKLICLYRGGYYDEQAMYSMWNALEQQQRDRIHIIHFGRRRMESFKFTNSIKKDYYYPLKNTADIEGMSLLNLSENEIVRFSLRLCHLEEEINRMEDSELKFQLHSFQPLHSFQDDEDCIYGSIAFMDGAGKVVAALGRRDLVSISDGKYVAQRFIKSIMNDIEAGGKEMHDENPGVFDSLIQNLQTTAAAAVEQQNVDAYFESLREYISELWGMELSQAFRFNKEGKKRSLPSVTWPTSRGFCRLKNFLSEGISDDWVKDIISRHPEEEYNPAIGVHDLLKDIEEAQWAVAGLLAVADVLERFQTISANRMVYLSLLWEMFSVAQYIKQFDQKPGLWRGVKRVATAIIVAYSFHCCSQIDQSKFALFSDRWDYGEGEIRENCDIMANAITEGPSNEGGSLLQKMCDCFPRLRFFLEVGDEGGPSCEGERRLCRRDWFHRYGEAGPFYEGESDVSAVEAGSTATPREEE